jgi:hypothetical protein
MLTVATVPGTSSVAIPLMLLASLLLLLVREAPGTSAVAGVPALGLPNVVDILSVILFLGSGVPRCSSCLTCADAAVLTVVEDPGGHAG